MNRASFVLLFPLMTAWVSAQNAEQIYKSASKSVMTLYVHDSKGRVIGNGTAFLVDANGIAVTAYHVLEGAQAATVKFADGKSYRVLGVIDANPAQDIAVIRIDHKGRPALRVNRQVPAIGAQTYVIGAPKGLEFSISQGIVNQVRKQEGLQVIQFSAPVSPGNSGSPLLNELGEAVGVVSYQLNDGQNLNFAVPSHYVWALDFRAPIQKLPLKGTSAPVATTPATQGSWKRYSFQDTGLDFSLPMAPEWGSSKLEPDIAQIAKRFRSASAEADGLFVSFTFFDFKPGQCPKTRLVADEVLNERTRSLQSEGIKVGKGPSLVTAQIRGADEAHAIVNDLEVEGVPLVETTVIFRKGNRLWMVLISFAASDESGPRQLKRILDSLTVG